MTAKFKRTLADTVNDVKKGAIAAARDINDNTKMASDVKRAEIEQNHVPAWAKDALTPDEVKRAGSMGLAVGMAIVVIFILLTLWCVGFINGWWGVIR